MSRELLAGPRVFIMADWSDFERSILSLKIDHYAKDGGSGAVWNLCGFYQEPLRT